MPTIKPVSGLRSYTDVLKDVAPGSPVSLTRNGHGAYAILDMTDCDRELAAHALLHELDRGRASGEEEGWLSEKSIRDAVDAILNHA